MNNGYHMTVGIENSDFRFYKDKKQRKNFTEAKIKIHLFYKNAHSPYRAKFEHIYFSPNDIQTFLDLSDKTRTHIILVPYELGSRFCHLYNKTKPTHFHPMFLSHFTLHFAQLNTPDLTPSKRRLSSSSLLFLPLPISFYFIISSSVYTVSHQAAAFPSRQAPRPSNATQSPNATTSGRPPPLLYRRHYNGGINQITQSYLFSVTPFTMSLINCLVF